MAETHGFGVLSLIFGLMSIPFAFYLIGPPIAVLGIIFFVVQNRKSPTKVASTGLILSLIGLLLYWIIWLFSLIIAQRVPIIPE